MIWNKPGLRPVQPPPAGDQAAAREQEPARQQALRLRRGRQAALIGIAANLLLSVAKFVTGLWSDSVSLMGDAANNLSDAVSSVIALFSFKLAAKPADREHPFGHARMEYFSSTIVAVIILFIALQLGQSSVSKIIEPDQPAQSLPAVLVLLLSIVVKLCLYRLNHRLARRTQSTLLAATATDALSDVLASATVLLSLLLSPRLGFQLDGYAGLLVACYIGYQGVAILRDTADKVLGQSPSPQLVREIERRVMAYPQVLAVHDLLIHSYGPGMIYVSLHVEMNAATKLLASHEVVDQIERELNQAYGFKTVIHLDPITINDPVYEKRRHRAEDLLSKIDPSLTMHDFRADTIAGKLVYTFDILAPYELERSDEDLREQITRELRQRHPACEVRLTIDRGTVTAEEQLNPEQREAALTQRTRHSG
ncbi:cation diffusion facilitator family transporter [Oscillospiraceae bacterium HV4-5-C5C]|nr:cation diffusion facilitator family transporter [Oscillospiraceae bacterium HV4-5-C5C]